MHEVQRISPALWGLAELAMRAGRSAEAIELCERALLLSEEVADAAYLFPFLVTDTRTGGAAKSLSHSS